MELLKSSYEFRIKVRDWLTKLGYSPIWSHNHPNSLQDKVHYTVNKFRICCEKDNQEEYCYLLHEFYQDNKPFAIKSFRLAIGSDLTEHIDRMNLLIKYLPCNLKKLSLFDKFKLLFKNI